MTTDNPIAFIDEKPSKEPAATTPEPVTGETPPATEGPARDEHGRFAATPAPAAPSEPVKTEADKTPPVVPPAPAAVKQEHPIPLPVFLEADNERRELKRELARLKQELQTKTAPPPADLPDPIQDPVAYKQAILKEARESFEPELRKSFFAMSENLARQQYGDEKVNAAFDALEAANDPYAYQRVVNSPNPGDALVKWHQQKLLIDSIGSDPDAFALRRAAEIAAAGQQAAPNGQPPPPPVTPPIPPASLSRAPAGQRAADVAVGEGQAFDAAFRH